MCLVAKVSSFSEPKSTAVFGELLPTKRSVSQDCKRGEAEGTFPATWACPSDFPPLHRL